MNHASVLIATDLLSDAKMVRGMLGDAFDCVAISAVPSQAVSDFEANQPEVLILAFSSLEMAERHYLILDHSCQGTPALACRTVVLCDQHELMQTYQRCREGRFDDYVLFWPLVHDAPRLTMAVMHALRNLELTKAAQSSGPRAVRKLADRAQPLVLIVDDSAFERKLAAKVLGEAWCDMVFAESGAEALALLNTVRPDLILLDIDMPDIDGLETLRCLKRSPYLVSIPVVMVTGHNEREIVVQCLRAGAVDYAIKPLERATLLKKVRRYLHRDGRFET
jgi:CheY-like chemotaxis protein